jgi:DNA-directed RNA polymerase specialized sigma24 family protein
VNEEGVDNPPGNAAVRDLMADGTLRTIIGWLIKEFPDAKADAEDAVVDAVVRFLAKRSKGELINEPGGWIRVAAANRIRNLLRRRINRERSDEYLDDGPATFGEPTPADKETFTFLKTLIDRWPSKRMKVITLLYLEAGYEQEPLSQQEAAELASQILGEDVPWTAVGKTHQRGMERLRAEILAIASETGINPITGEETA